MRRDESEVALGEGFDEEGQKGGKAEWGGADGEGTLFIKLTLTLSVTSIERNFLLSPISIQLLMRGHSFLMMSSIGMGGMFSPPAVMINSVGGKQELQSQSACFYRKAMPGIDLGSVSQRLRST